MKQLINLFSVALFLYLLSIPARLSAEINPLDENGEQALRSAIQSVDEGNLDVGIAMFESLLSLFPDNYTVRYELAYAHVLASDYEKALEIIRPLTYHPDATPQLFSIIGSCYDDLNQPDRALEAYNSGLKRFPESGLLHVEKGITAYRQENFEEALNQFEEAIVADPQYDAAYYRAANLYSQTNIPLLAMIYAEAHMLLSGRQDRNENMSEMIGAILQDKIKIDNDTIRVSLVSLAATDAPNLSPLKKMLMWLEMGYTLGIEPLLNGWNFASVTALRKKAVELMVSQLPPTNRMALQKFQLAVIEAGHWEAYNSYILAAVFPDEVRLWNDNPDNEHKFETFLNWLQEHQEYYIGPDNTVSFRLLDREK